MESKKNLLVTCVLVVAAFWVAWYLHPDAPEGSVRVETARKTETVPRDEYDRVVDELKTEREQFAAFKKDVEEAAKVAVADEPEKDAATAGPEESGPRFVYAETQKALKDLDWKTMAKSMHALPPLLEELVEFGRSDEEEFPASIGDIQRWNGPLLKEVAKLQSRDEVPGSNVNGKFTHPSVYVNLIYGALIHSDVPLSEKQEEELYRIGLRFVEEDSRRRAGYGEGVIELRKMIDANALKDRFFAAVDAMLTPAQRHVLHPEGMRGTTVGDLFSSGVVWNTVTKTAGFSTRKELEEMFARGAMARFKLPESARPVVQSLTRAWSQGMSDEFLSAPLTRAEKDLKIMQVARIRKVAALQANVQEALIAQLDLQPDQRKRVAKTLRVLVPYKRPSPETE